MIDPTPPDQDQRKTRHLDMLEELAALAMALARSAAEKAQAQLDDPTPEPRPDPVLAFARLSCTVRQLIALEARIASPDAKARAATTPKPIDEAREFIAEATRACAKADPAATRRHGPTKRHIERNIDERLKADDVTEMIEEDMPAYVIVSTMCDDLNIECDVNKQPDENLEPLSEALEARRKARTPRPPTVYAEEDFAEPAPDPKATPPPADPRR